MAFRRTIVLSILATLLVFGTVTSYVMLETGRGWINAVGTLVLSAIVVLPTAVVVWFVE